jgi:hypothetical protein
MEKQQEEKEKEGAILVVVAPDGTVSSATSWREVAERARAYREGR